MDVFLKFADLILHISAEGELLIDESLLPFCTAPANKPDVNVRVSWDWDASCLPQTTALGEDAICRYYAEGEYRYCLTRGGPKGPVARAIHTADYNEIRCVMNEKPFLMPPKNLGSILRFLPIRAMFQHFRVLFLHAAQISYSGRGILFTAPSGTGKTTQAKLWRDNRGAEILCNDRTLVRNCTGFWKTYGYPIDGSEPVRSSEIRVLACVVVLRQGAENHVERLKASRSASCLMMQAVIDGWSAEARSREMDLIFSLLDDTPVYLLTCTPDVRAVDVLADKLIEDGVIANGSDIESSLE